MVERIVFNAHGRWTIKKMWVPGTYISISTHHHLIIKLVDNIMSTVKVLCII